MFDQAATRDPEHRRRWIVLVDGNNHQIDRIQHEAAQRGVHVDIVIDFVHVLEYLWRAAEDLHASRAARQTHVAEMARTILEGHAGRVIADLRAQAHSRHGDLSTDTGHTHACLPGLQRTVDYLTAKQPYLGYHIALTLGWPIATGVIEGCCRYLIKDRLDLTVTFNGFRRGYSTVFGVLSGAVGMVGERLERIAGPDTRGLATRSVVWCVRGLHDADDEVLAGGFDDFFGDGGDLVDLKNAFDLVDEPGGEPEVAVGDPGDGGDGFGSGVVVAVAEC